MDAKICSILITTYNRINFLQTTVSLFISQIISGGLVDQVEVIIGDDSSSDGTKEYLTCLKKYKFIRAVSHPKNLGLSGNIEKLTELASGRYLWHFGEDDLIVGGAIKKVLQIISARRPNYLLLNTKNIISLDGRNLNYEIVNENRLNISNDIFIKDFQREGAKLLEIENWLYLTGLLSAMVCKKNLFLDWMEKAKQLVARNNVYLYQAPIIMGIASLGGLCLVAEPLILHRKNENHWSGSVDRMLAVNLYDSHEIINVVNKYMPGECARYQKRFAAFILASILSAKKQGVNANKYLIAALKRNYNCYPYNLRFLALLFIPGAVIRLLKLGR